MGPVSCGNRVLELVQKLDRVFNILGDFAVFKYALHEVSPVMPVIIREVISFYNLADVYIILGGKQFDIQIIILIIRKRIAVRATLSITDKATTVKTSAIEKRNETSNDLDRIQ